MCRSLAISGLIFGCCQIARAVRTSCAQYSISRASFSASKIQCRADLVFAFARLARPRHLPHQQQAFAVFLVGKL